MSNMTKSFDEELTLDVAVQNLRKMRINSDAAESQNTHAERKPSASSASSAVVPVITKVEMLVQTLHGGTTESGNKVTGSGNRISGSENKVSGKNNIVIGSGNIVTGSGNRVVGSRNKITGSQNIVTGSGFVITGSGKKITGDETDGPRMRQLQGNF